MRGLTGTVHPTQMHSPVGSAPRNSGNITNRAYQFWGTHTTVSLHYSLLHTQGRDSSALVSLFPLWHLMLQWKFVRMSHAPVLGVRNLYTQMALPWEWILALFFSGEQHPSSHQTDTGRTGCPSAEKNVSRGSARATAARVKGKRWDHPHRAHILWSRADDTWRQRHRISSGTWTSASPALAQSPFTRVCDRLTTSNSVYSHFYELLLSSL